MTLRSCKISESEPVSAFISPKEYSTPYFPNMYIHLSTRTKGQIIFYLIESLDNVLVYDICSVKLLASIGNSSGRIADTVTIVQSLVSKTIFLSTSLGLNFTNFGAGQKLYRKLDRVFKFFEFLD